MTTPDFERDNIQYRAYLEDINKALEVYFPLKECRQKKVFEAGRYSLLAGGKRIRPLLALEFCRIFGGSRGKAMPFACALEMIHTYSLIHDDMPCMDDDDYRRGMLSNHKMYGEAMALLAGDALLTAAFETVLNNSAMLSNSQVLEGLRLLANSAGAKGMIGGQVLDIESTGKPLSMEELTEMHMLKTGALIKTACILGAVAANADETGFCIAEEYGENLGLAFQITDDILDATRNSDTLGKSAGKDEKQQKNTYVTLLGLADAGILAAHYTDKALAAADKLSEGEFLTELTGYLLNRDH